MLRIWIVLLLFVFLSVNGIAQIYGCTDPQANNFNPDATFNDGSCQYNTTIDTPVLLFELPDQLDETSGLVYYNGGYWTHNDSGGEPEIYKLDTTDGTILQTVSITNAQNVDWEDLAIDAQYIFIGDIGNNSGARTDLKIYRINKSDIGSGSYEEVQAAIIEYSYEDQESFVPAPQNNNFDCEAMIVYGDSLFLFSKNWINQQTKWYSLPKTEGIFEANLRESYNTNGLVTAASYNAQYEEIILLGYVNQSWLPFYYVLFDFQSGEVFSGNKRRIEVPSLLASQTEGVTYTNEKDFIISGEKTIISEAKISVTSTAPWTDPLTGIPDYTQDLNISIKVYPNPASGRKVKIKIHDLSSSNYVLEVIDSSGRRVQKSSIYPKKRKNKALVQLDIQDLNAGMYFVNVYCGTRFASQTLIINK